jgi:hypothetical protein
MTLRGALAAGLMAAVMGCGGPDFQPVTVRVQAPDVTGKVVPIAGAEFTLLPFDIDSLYKALEEKNQAGPMPQTDSLEALFQAFTQADESLPRSDSLLSVKQSALEEIRDRTSDEYRQAFAAYQNAQTERDSLAAARDSLNARYAPAREAYNRARKTWEASAWDGFSKEQEKVYSIAEAPHDSAGEETTWKQKTGEDGTFKFWVKPGRWWLVGRVGVPGSVHEVYRWNVPITVGKEPLTVELTGDQAKRLKTY